MPEQSFDIAIDHKKGIITAGDRYVERFDENGLATLLPRLNEPEAEALSGAMDQAGYAMGQSRKKIRALLGGLDQAEEKLSPLFNENPLEWQQKQLELDGLRSGLTMHDKRLETDLSNFNQLTSMVREETDNPITRFGRDLGKVLGIAGLVAGVDPLDSFRSSGFFTNRWIEGYNSFEIAQRTGKFVERGTEAYDNYGGPTSGLAAFILEGHLYGDSGAWFQATTQAFGRGDFETGLLELIQGPDFIPNPAQLIDPTESQQQHEQLGTDETTGGKVARFAGEIVPGLAIPLSADLAIAKGISRATGLTSAGKALGVPKAFGAVKAAGAANRGLTTGGAVAGAVGGAVGTEGDLADKLRGGVGGAMLGFGAGHLAATGKGFLKGYNPGKTTDSILEAAGRAGGVVKGKAKQMAADAGMSSKAQANAATGDADSTFAQGVYDRLYSSDPTGRERINSVTDAIMQEKFEGRDVRSLTEKEMAGVLIDVRKEMHKEFGAKTDRSDILMQWHMGSHSDLATIADPKGNYSYFPEDKLEAIQAFADDVGVYLKATAQESQVRSEAMGLAAKLQKANLYEGRSLDQVADLLTKRMETNDLPGAHAAAESLVGPEAGWAGLNVRVPQSNYEVGTHAGIKFSTKATAKVHDVELVKQSAPDQNGPTWLVRRIANGELIQVSESKILDISKTEMSDVGKALAGLMQTPAQVKRTKAVIAKKQLEAAPKSALSPEEAQVRVMEGFQKEADEIGTKMEAIEKRIEKEDPNDEFGLGDKLFDETDALETRLAQVHAKMDAVEHNDPVRPHITAEIRKDLEILAAEDIPTDIVQLRAERDQVFDLAPMPERGPAVDMTATSAAFEGEVERYVGRKPQLTTGLRAEIAEKWAQSQRHKNFQRDALSGDDPENLPFLLRYFEGTVHHPQIAQLYAYQRAYDLNRSIITTRDFAPAQSMQNLMDKISQVTAKYLKVSHAPGSKVNIFAAGKTMPEQVDALAKLVYEDISRDFDPLKAGMLFGSVADIAPGQRSLMATIMDDLPQFADADEFKQIMLPRRAKWAEVVGEEEADKLFELARIAADISEKDMVPPGQGADLSRLERTTDQGSVTKDQAPEVSTRGQGKITKKSDDEKIQAKDATLDKLKELGWEDLQQEGFPVEKLMSSRWGKMRSEILAEDIVHTASEAQSLMSKHKLGNKQMERKYNVGVANNWSQRGFVPRETVKRFVSPPKGGSGKKQFLRPDNVSTDADFHAGAVLQLLSGEPLYLHRLLMNMSAHPTARAYDQLAGTVGSFNTKFVMALESVIERSPNATDEAIAEEMTRWVDKQRGTYGLLPEYDVTVSPKVAKNVRSMRDSNTGILQAMSSEDVRNINLVLERGSTLKGIPKGQQVQAIHDAAMGTIKKYGSAPQKALLEELELAGTKYTPEQFMALPEAKQAALQDEAMVLIERIRQEAQNISRKLETTGGPDFTALAAAPLGLLATKDQDEDESNLLQFIAGAAAVVLGIVKGPQLLKAMGAKFATREAGDEAIKNAATQATFVTKQRPSAPGTTAHQQGGWTTRTIPNGIGGGRNPYPLSHRKLSFVPDVKQVTKLPDGMLIQRKAHLTRRLAESEFTPAQLDEAVSDLNHRMMSEGVTPRSTFDELVVEFADDGTAVVVAPEMLDATQNWQSIVQRKMRGPEGGKHTHVDLSGHEDVDLTSVLMRVSDESRSTARSYLGAWENGAIVALEKNADSLASVLDGSRDSGFVRHLLSEPPTGKVEVGGKELHFREHRPGILEVSNSPFPSKLSAKKRALAHGVPPEALQELKGTHLLKAMFGSPVEGEAGVTRLVPMRNRPEVSMSAASDVYEIHKRLMVGNAADKKVALNAQALRENLQQLEAGLTSVLERNVGEGDLRNAALLKGAEKDQSIVGQKVLEAAQAVITPERPAFGSRLGGDQLLSLELNTSGATKQVVSQLSQSRNVFNDLARETQKIQQRLLEPLRKDPAGQERIINSLNKDTFEGLSDRELVIARSLRHLQDSILDMVNDSRIAVGQKPVKRIGGYFTRVMENFGETFHSLPESRGVSVPKIINHFKKRRLGETDEFSMNLSDVMDLYTRTMLTDAVYTPVMHNMEAIRPLMHPETWDTLKRVANDTMGRRKARLDNMLGDAAGKVYLAGKRMFAGSMTLSEEQRIIQRGRKHIEDTMVGLAKWVRLVPLGLSLRTTGLQYLQGFPTVTEIGLKNAGMASKMMFEAGFTGGQLPGLIGGFAGFQAGEDASIGQRLLQSAAGAGAGVMGGRLLGRGMARINPEKYAHAKGILDQVIPGHDRSTSSGLEDFRGGGIIGKLADILGEGINGLPGGYTMMTAADSGMRRHAALGGYLEATQRGLTGTDRIDFARQTVHRTQFMYAPGSKPGIIRAAGKIGSPLTALKSYPVRSSAWFMGKSKEMGQIALRMKKGTATDVDKRVFSSAIQGAAAVLGFYYLTSTAGIYITEDIGLGPVEIGAQLYNDPQKIGDILLRNPASNALVDLYGVATNDPRARPLEETVARYIIPSQLKRTFQASTVRAYPGQGTAAWVGKRQQFISGGGFNSGVEATPYRKALQFFGLRDAARQRQFEKLRDRNRDLTRFNMGRSQLVKEATQALREEDWEAGQELMNEAAKFYINPKDFVRAVMSSMASQQQDPEERQQDREPKAFRRNQLLGIE